MIAGDFYSLCNPIEAGDSLAIVVRLLPDYAMAPLSGVHASVLWFLLQIELVSHCSL